MHVSQQYLAVSVAAERSAEMRCRPRAQACPSVLVRKLHEPLGEADLGTCTGWQKRRRRGPKPSRLPSAAAGMNWSRTSESGSLLSHRQYFRGEATPVAVSCDSSEDLLADWLAHKSLRCSASLQACPSIAGADQARAAPSMTQSYCIRRR